MNTRWIIFFSGMYAVLNSIAALIVKNKLLTHKINQFQDFIIFLFDPWIAGAFVLILFSMFFSMKALSLSDFSFVIPITVSINFILTILIGVFFFKDEFSSASYLGVILIFIGISLLAKSYGR
ncbi:hypothetical protein TUM19329_13320 [Legionella antarctica]|uniref:EamA domain-containing protein n=1 Tax=Legionella antarctica TaxID=2708020 RepID=A0A6F8T3C8_9GAMM|nr:hypothetical protein [Legionella antarctica]BCA94971.1 hypothetical protein TUM19329_13320 [Legionella antarctica]